MNYHYQYQLTKVIYFLEG